MDRLHILKVLLKNSPSTDNDTNKKLFEFLNNNYKEIIDSNYYIQPILVNSSNIDYFVQKNIESTPSLLDEVNNDKVVTGLINIIKYIVNLCESRSTNDLEDDLQNHKATQQSKSQFKNTNNELQDYLLGEAFKEDDTFEEPLDLNVVKNKEDKYKLNRERLLTPKYPNNIINTVKKNLNETNDNIVENYNNYQDEYTNLNTEITKTKPVSDYMSDDKDLQNFWENLEETT